MRQLLQYKRIFSIMILGTSLTPMSYAQNINDRIINLALGQWHQVQSTFIGGAEIEKAKFSKTSCVTEAESTLTVKDYSNKLMASISPETQCDISNLKGTNSEITFNLNCTASDSPFTTKLNMSYKYSREQVHVLAEGTIENGGQSTTLKIDSTTKKIGPCNT